MSRLRANQITNENANGAPNFPHGLTVTGIITATTTSTTLPQIIVGSAVTANSQGIDVTGIVTATTVKVGSAISMTDSAISATRYFGNGSALTGLSAGLQSVQVFGSSGTYTKPAGINKIKVIVTGAGGGGGGGTNNNNAGTGGGAGGTAIELIDVSALGSTVAVTVGTAGGNNTSTGSGGNGTASSFGSYCSATGGNGGGGADETRKGEGGEGSGGDLNVPGGDGMTGGGGPSSDDTPGGDGGASFWGGGGSKAKLNNQRVAGRDGRAFGSGGGAGVFEGSTHYASGAGKGGVVYVEEYA